MDSFKQPITPIANKVDILFVMDNSESMDRHWQLIATKIDKLIAEYPQGIDVRYSVLLGTIEKFSGQLWAARGMPVVLDGTKLTTPEISARLRQTFAAALDVIDWQGAGETAFYSLYQAVTKHVKANKKHGFFRPDAALELIFMSDDAETGTPYPSQQFWDLPPKCNWAAHEQVRKTFYLPNGITTDTTFQAVKNLKGDMPVVTNAFVNITREDILVDNELNARCIYDSPGLGYFDIVKKTNGVLYSIHHDRAVGLARVGKLLRKRMSLVHDFKLSKPSDKVDPTTIEAKVDGKKQRHTYNGLTNIVNLENAGKSGSLVQISHCEPVTQVEWNLTGFSGSAEQRSAALSWTTAEYATRGRILFGLNEDSLTEAVDSQTGTRHSVTVSGLMPNTDYFFQAVSWDEFGVEKRSEVISLRTKPDWNMGALSGQASRNSATLSWDTDYPTAGRILWGTIRGNLRNSTPIGSATEKHTVLVEDLNADTIYYFQAVSLDSFGLEKRGNVISLRTKSDWSIVGFGGAAGRNSATLEWQTPEYETVAKLYYGLSPDSLGQSASSPTPATSHRVTVDGLRPSTTYYFRVTAKDDLGAEKISTTISLRTLADWEISRLTTDSTETEFTVAFDTAGYPTNGKVLWGRNANQLDSEVVAGKDSTNHEARISNLSPDTLYFAQAVAIDNLGIEKRSQVIGIRTKAEVPPLPVWQITDFTGIASQSEVRLEWNTLGYPTSGIVRYGTQLDELNQSIAEDGPGINHALQVSGLTPNTLFYFQVVARDDKNQEQSSSVISVRTQAIPLPVWEISAVTAESTLSSVKVNWATDYPTQGELRWGTSEGSLINVENETASSMAHELSFAGLNPNTLYFFRIIARDDRGQEKQSQVYSIRTKSIPLPSWEISGVRGIPSRKAITIEWSTTDYLTQGEVRWGIASGALTNSSPESTPSRNHSLPISGLNADTIYYFQIVSRDDRGQEKVSEEFSVRTLPSGIADWKIQGFDGTTTANSATIIWQTPGALTNAVVKVGLTANDLNLRTIEVPDFKTVHLVTVPGLNPNTNYFFKVFAEDEEGGKVESSVLSKRTKVVR